MGGGREEEGGRRGVLDGEREEEGWKNRGEGEEEGRLVGWFLNVLVNY